MTEIERLRLMTVRLAAVCLDYDDSTEEETEKILDRLRAILDDVIRHEPYCVPRDDAG